MEKSDEWEKYRRQVENDFCEALEVYPYMKMIIAPTAEPSPIAISVIAVTKKLIEQCMGHPEDFCEDYTKEIFVELPYQYREEGCTIYGAKWLDKRKFSNKDLHFYELEKSTQYGYRMCVGTPDSFRLMKNVLLECVRTADAMLVAYERVQSGDDTSLYLIAYAHGNQGREQFKHDPKRYLSRYIK